MRRSGSFPSCFYLGRILLRTQPALRSQGHMLAASSGRLLARAPLRSGLRVASPRASGAALARPRPLCVSAERRPPVRGGGSPRSALRCRAPIPAARPRVACVCLASTPSTSGHGGAAQVRATAAGDVRARLRRVCRPPVRPVAFRRHTVLWRIGAGPGLSRPSRRDGRSTRRDATARQRRECRSPVLRCGPRPSSGGSRARGGSVPRFSTLTLSRRECHEDQLVASGPCTGPHSRVIVSSVCIHGPNTGRPERATT